MAQFVLVCSGINAAQLEKVLEVKIRSGSKINFVPQAVNGGATGSNGVTTAGMQSVRTNQNTHEVFNHVRFEWDEQGTEFGVEIIEALHHGFGNSRKVA